MAHLVPMAQEETRVCAHPRSCRSPSQKLAICEIKSNTVYTHIKDDHTALSRVLFQELSQRPIRGWLGLTVRHKQQTRYTNFTHVIGTHGWTLPQIVRGLEDSHVDGVSRHIKQAPNYANNQYINKQGHKSNQYAHFLANRLLPCPLGPQQSTTRGVPIGCCECIPSTQ